jgi:hypothetical protein
VCPAHRWASLFVQDGAANAPPGDTKKQNLNLVACHELLGRAMLDNPQVRKDGCMLLALTVHNLEDPRQRAKAACQRAERARPRYFDSTKQAEVEDAAAAEKEAAWKLSAYSRRIAPKKSPHAAFQSIDLSQRSVVVNLCGASSLMEDEPDHQNATTSAKQLEKERLRGCMGALPYALASALGISPCQYGFECAFRPAVDHHQRDAMATLTATAARGIAAATFSVDKKVHSDKSFLDSISRPVSSNAIEHPTSPPLRCCPVCLCKLSLALLESGVAFGPTAKERLMVAGFSTNADLAPLKSLVKSDLEWSESFLQGVELELFGSSSTASSALVAQQFSEPKSFDAHRHKFRAIGAADAKQSSALLKESTPQEKGLLHEQERSSPPYPGTERFAPQHARSRVDALRTTTGAQAARTLLLSVSPALPTLSASWEAGAGQLWLENSLVSRQPHVKAQPAVTWVDPTRSRFGGVAPEHRRTQEKDASIKYGAFQLEHTSS